MILSRQEHGGRWAWTQLESLDILDLSVNVNPFGPPSGLREYLLDVPWHAYPDPNCQHLLARLAASTESDPSHIVLGNGANELLWALARSLLRPGSRFATLEPTYTELTRAGHKVGAQHRPFVLDLTQLTNFPSHALDQYLQTEAIDLLYICNPHSPTGAVWPEQILAELAARHPRCYIVIDQSFRNLSLLATREAIAFPSNVLQVSSMTKDYALAGLRLGYLRASSKLAEAIRQEIPTWSVNALAQAAGRWCLEHPGFAEHSCLTLMEDRRVWEHELLQRGLEVLPSGTIFLMFRVPEALDRAERLLEHYGILVRSCRSYGLPDWWRVAVRPDADRRRFFQALDEVLPSISRP